MKFNLNINFIFCTHEIKSFTNYLGRDVWISSIWSSEFEFTLETGLELTLSDTLENNDFKNLLKKGKDFGFQIPFQLDDNWVLTMLFSYHFFQHFHYCLKDLFINDNISQENFTKISNLLSW